MPGPIPVVMLIVKYILLLPILSKRPVFRRPVKTENFHSDQTPARFLLIVNIMISGLLDKSSTIIII